MKCREEKLLDFFSRKKIHVGIKFSQLNLLVAVQNENGFQMYKKKKIFN